MGRHRKPRQPLHEKTMQQNRVESNNFYKRIVIQQHKFADKQNCLIIAKTWGAAHNFVKRTSLSTFRHLKIRYLRTQADLAVDLNNKNTIVILLSAAFDKAENIGIHNVVRNRRIEILEYNVV